MAPCPIIDHPQDLRAIIAESGAHPTHEGAESILEGEIAQYLDNLSSQWQEKSKPIFEQRTKKA
jgi:hypothetical protein